jgi:hypothetical protein
MSGPRRKISDRILDGWAPGVAYQFRVTTIQLGTLVDKYGNVMPPGFSDAGEDALLEASLVHLRGLDDFFGNRSEGATERGPRDVRAIDWIPNWPGNVWLDPAVRSLINWKVAHLTVVSGIRYEWQLATQGTALCEQITAFMDSVANDKPDRLPAFLTESDPRGVVAHFEPIFAKHA